LNVPEIEFTTTITVYNKENNQKIIKEGVKINFLEIGQQINDSQFTLTPISWKIYLNQTITMLVNLILIRFKISDLYTINDK
jgi:hypothetical protein